MAKPLTDAQIERWREALVVTQDATVSMSEAAHLIATIDALKVEVELQGVLDGD